MGWNQSRSKASTSEEILARNSTFCLAEHQNSKGWHLLQNEVLHVFNFGNAKYAFI